MLRTKGGQGFPYLVVMDVDGSVLDDEIGRSLDGFRKAVIASQSFLDLRVRAAHPKAAMKTRVDYFFQCLDRGVARHAVARAQFKLLELSPAQKKRGESLLVELEFVEIEASIQGKSDYPRAGSQFAAMKSAGRVPTGRSARSFWLLISFYAEGKEDLALFSDCVEALEPLLRGKKRSLEKLAKRHARLLKAGK